MIVFRAKPFKQNLHFNPFKSLVNLAHFISWNITKGTSGDGVEDFNALFTGYS